MIRKITIKFLLLVSVISVCNLIYSFTFFEKELNEKCPEFNQIKSSQTQTDVYYFGESSNITYKENDSSKESISDFTTKFLKDVRFTNINKYATHTGIYKEWLNFFDMKRKLPKAIVFTLNMRSFDANWRNSKLETALQESLVLTKPYPNIVNRFLLSLQAFDNNTEKQREEQTIEEWKTTELIFPYSSFKTTYDWDNYLANGFYKLPNGDWNIPKIELACHYVKAFAFNLNEKNIRIQDCDEIVEWCNQNKIKLYFNLMAENINFADSLVGKDLLFLMKQNRDFLMKRFNNKNSSVVDNLELVEGKYFIDKNWTTEHYTCQGRMKIAKNLAQVIKKQFENNYLEAY